MNGLGDALDEYLRSVGTPGTGISVDGSSQVTADEPTAPTAAPLQRISEE